MDDAQPDLVLASPMLAVGVVVLGLGAHRAVRAARTQTRSWQSGVWSTAALLTAGGAIFLAIGILFALGLADVGLGVLEAAGALAALALGGAAVRAARAGQRRNAAVLGSTALALLVIFGLIALDLDTAVDVALAVLTGGLLLLSIVAITRRWSRSDTPQRFTLMQSLALGVGLSAQAAAQLLPPPHHALRIVLSAAGLAALVVALGLILARRRHSSRLQQH